MPANVSQLFSLVPLFFRGVLLLFVTVCFIVQFKKIKPIISSSIGTLRTDRVLPVVFGAGYLAGAIAGWIQSLGGTPNWNLYPIRLMSGGSVGLSQNPIPTAGVWLAVVVGWTGWLDKCRTRGAGHLLAILALGATVGQFGLSSFQGRYILMLLAVPFLVVATGRLWCVLLPRVWKRDAAPAGRAVFHRTVLWVAIVTGSPILGWISTSAVSRLFGVAGFGNWMMLAFVGRSIGTLLTMVLLVPVPALLVLNGKPLLETLLDALSVWTKRWMDLLALIAPAIWLDVLGQSVQWVANLAFYLQQERTKTVYLLLFGATVFVVVSGLVGAWLMVAMVRLLEREGFLERKKESP